MEKRKSFHCPGVCAECDNQECVKDVSVATAYELMHLGVGEIIDVRETWELEMGEAIPDAHHMPLYTVKAFSGEHVPEELLETETEVPFAVDMPMLVRMLNTHREKGALLLCLCRSGNRSRDAVKLLKTLGYSNTFNVAGGINAWQEAGFATRKLANLDSARCHCHDA